MLNNSKVIVLDFGIFLHRAIFAWIKNRQVPPTYTCMNMIMSCLKRVGINKDDLIIVAVDSEKGSWRKRYEKAYKANRKEQRARYNIDWKDVYGQFDVLLSKLNVATDWQIVKLDHMEADDIMATASKYYSDKTVVLVSYDSDLEMLSAYDNTYIFSPMTKRYKERAKSPYKILAKKIRKEVADNLTTDVATEEEFEIRKKVVDLIHLPEEIETPITESFNNFVPKPLNIDLIPFRSIRNTYKEIYDSNKIITYEESIKKAKRKKKRKKRKVKNENL